MELATLIGAAALVVAVVAYVTAPVWRRSGLPADQSLDESQLRELAYQRDVTLKTLRDLDFDYQLGKLSEEDYQTLRARYAAQGVVILQQLDAAAGLSDTDLEGEVEAEVERRRSLGQSRREVEELAPPLEQPVGQAVPAAGTDEPVLDEIEAEVRRRRALRAAPVAVAAAKLDQAEQPRGDQTKVSAGRPETGSAGQCAGCGLPFQPGDKFCARCGAALAHTCPACGTVIASDARFCAQCGEKLIA